MHEICHFAQTPEAYTYDTDGNLLTDGRWTYTWDGENRLLNMTSLSGNPDGSKLALDFAYDSKGRRIQKTVSQWDTGTSAYIPQSTNRFVYDGWNLLAELNVDVSLKETFMWGSDLSGSMQGAGGVGGLLSVKQPGVLTNFVSYDGNGNVTALANASDATLTAIYEYGPFGEVIRATGPMAKLNPFRFSTKFQDDESDLLYYGYRYLNTSTGRWINRDPLQEQGGINLYEFCLNNSVSIIDILGMGTWHPDIKKNGTPDANIDVNYKFDDTDYKGGCGCKTGVIDRYVTVGVGFGVGVYASDDTEGIGGAWDALNGAAHAEGDAPEGIGIRFIGRIPANFNFLWKVRCTSGADNGKILSQLEKKLHVNGHAIGGPIIYSWLN